MNRFFKMMVMIATIIIADQLTKAVVQQKFSLGETVPLIKGLFSFTYVKNPGAAWGMSGNAGPYIRIPLLFILPVVACFWLIYAVWSHRNTRLLPCLSYSLIFAGAVGNLIDRFSLDYVVDFLDFYIGTSHFPAFNVADSSITIGAILLGIELLFLEKKANAANPV
jgi:signal peptidase II